jgi:tetratricopeptide (TPR) repeat protein
MRHRANSPNIFVCFVVFVGFVLSSSISSAQSGKEQRILQIQELMQRGDLPEARKLLSQSKKEFPSDAGFDNLLGIIEAQERNYKAAESAFQSAIARAPKFTGAYLNLGRLYLENSSADGEALSKALRTYRNLLRYQPENLEANYQTAVILQLRGDYRGSLEQLSRLPESYRRSAQALSLYCANYAGLGERARTGESAETLIKHQDFSEADVNSILPALAKAQAYDLSVKLLEGLISRDLGSPEARQRLGLLYENLDRLDEARAMLDKSATGEKPLTGQIGLLIDLARVAHKQRDFQGALGYLAHARDLEPQNAGIHYFFGLVCIDMNLGVEAHAALEKAVKLEPENPQYNFVMGFVSSYRHNPEEAIPYLEKYLRLKPGDARGKLIIGMAYFRSKNYEAAQTALKDALSERATSAPARYYLGSIARQENRIDDAVRELEQALQIKPDYPDALAELGQCRLQERDYPKAENLLQRALKLDPQHYNANFNLLTLYRRTNDPRADEQTAKFEELKKKREERAQDFLRLIEVRPY